MPAPASGTSTPAQTAAGATTMDANSMVTGMTMMAGQLGRYAMARDASGTSWQPDSSPEEGLAWRSGDWTGMIHGYADFLYDHQGGPRGADEAFGENMLMVMAQHGAGPGSITLRTMFSLDPLMGPSGYPLSLQTGETANGATPLIDRQHPHNLFMELASVYSQPLTANSSAFFYVGYPGEPALGPTTFMHRFSGMDDPAAPIAHHWLDSAHVTFGVITTGYARGPWKIEGSVFNGREPDQHRWGFNAPRFDSYSGRITYNPTADLSFQVSYGNLKSPEQLTPQVDQQRITSSATYNRNFGDGNWQTTFAWGRNHDRPGATLDAFLLESAIEWRSNTWFARAENVGKDDLFTTGPFEGKIYDVSELSVGYIHDIPVQKHMALGVGVLGTINFVPAAIQPAYGGNPTSYMGFLRLKIE